MDIVDRFIDWVDPFLGDFGCIYIGIGVMALVTVVAITKNIRG